jgi:hypothetical protein
LIEKFATGDVTVTSGVNFDFLTVKINIQKYAFSFRFCLCHPGIGGKNFLHVFRIEGTCSKSTHEVSKMGGNETDHVLIVRFMNGTF